MDKRRSKKVLDRISNVNSILNEYDSDMTIRQIFYQFVSRNWILNTVNGYRRVQYAIKEGRFEGDIDWNRIVDLSRPEYEVSTWDSLSSFLKSVRSSFKLDFWDGSDNYVEVWTEKDALSGVIRPITEQFRVKLVVVRGYDSLSNLIRARARYQSKSNPTIIYVGDHDPSGLDIPKSISRIVGDAAIVERVALTLDQIKEYGLPSQRVKREDPRSYGYSLATGLTECWELDALPPDILRTVITDAISKFVDFDIPALQRKERSLVRDLLKLLDGAGGGSSD